MLPLKWFIFNFDYFTFAFPSTWHKSEANHLRPIKTLTPAAKFLISICAENPQILFPAPTNPVYFGCKSVGTQPPGNLLMPSKIRLLTVRAGCNSYDPEWKLASVRFVCCTSFPILWPARIFWPEAIDKIDPKKTSRPRNIFQCFRTLQLLKYEKHTM